MSIEPGLRGEREFEVDDRLLTDVGGWLGSPVLSTPSRIGMMEWAAAKVVNPRLPEGHATVGFEVCVKHVAAAARGARASRARRCARWSTGESCSSTSTSSRAIA